MNLSPATAKNALVLGASGAMGRALVKKFIDSSDIDTIFAVSRRDQSPIHPKVIPIKTEYTESAMGKVAADLTEYAGTFSRVCICHGILHNEQIFPEKRIEDIDANALGDIYYANATVPALWLKLLTKILVGEQICKVACFSARVGSTADNRLGGWYSYRASKAALNSLLKTFAIEYARRAKNIKLIAFHPGTVKSEMSKPFQSSVPEGKLFDPIFVAGRLAEIMDKIECDGELSYLDYAGKPIPW